jgi:hypothetical protein
VGRAIQVLVALATIVLPAPPALADAPSITVDDLQVAPGGGFGYQQIHYYNLPDGTDVRGIPPPELGQGHMQIGDGVCYSNYQVANACTVKGSGTLQWSYGLASVAPSVYLGSAPGAKTFTFSASVDSLGLSASATVSLYPQSDLRLRLDAPDYSHVNVTIFNFGPSYSAAQTLTVNGLPVGAAVGIFAPYVKTCGYATCTLPTMSTTITTNITCPSVKDPRQCIQAEISASSNGGDLPVTITVTGDYPDPNPANNSVSTVTPPSTYAVADPPPSTSNNGGPGPVVNPGPGSALLPEATTTDPATTAPTTQTPSGAATDQPTPTIVAAQPGDGPGSPSALSWALAVIVALLLAAAAPVGLHLLTRRAARRRATMEGSDA